MKLSKLQEEILNAPYNRIIVLSSAASGKTRLMTEKVRQLLRAGVNPKEIAVITFTTMAATELRQRLGDDYKDGLFVGTIHALANYFLLSSGVSTGKVLDNEDFDKLFEMVEAHPGCVRPVEYLLLDEAQDTDALQFKFILEMINPTSFFLCGDVRQSIYGFRGSRPDLLMQLAHREDVKVFDMNENYRNGYNVLAFAKRLIKPTGLIDTSIAMKEGNGAVAEVPYDSGLIVTKIKDQPVYDEWAILTRTNSEISTICTVLGRAGIPYDTFKQGDLSKQELLEKMNQNTVKVLTVHSAKGLEWDNVIVIGMRYRPEEERNVCYVAATRARENLIWMYYTKKKKSPQIYKW